MRRSLILLVVLAGCDRVFTIHEHELADATESSECNSIYELSFPGVSESRYFVLERADTFVNQRSICRSHARGTHLAKIDDTAELMALHAHLGNVMVPDPLQPWAWVGLLQLSTATTPQEGWSWLVGGEVAPGLWDIAPNPPEPNDDNATEGDDTNQDGGTIYLPTGFVHDRALSARLIGVCECDGLPEL